ISQVVYDIEEATAEAFDLILSQKAIKSSETSALFIRFIQLLAAHHASRRCRKGAAEILGNYDDLCPSRKCSYEASGGKDTLGNFPICGKDVPRGYYLFCLGSRNDTRGFSCKLWVLFHSLSVRTEDGESHFAFTTTTSSCDEASLSTGEPLFPKVIWPPRELCPSCYLSSDQKSIEWYHDNVYESLKNYYGPKLVSLCKEKSAIGGKEETISANEDLTVATNALVVPIGAALAITVASCAFGALACY
ncbi:hypothetical protein N665_0472s0023, partial [Sinapis alba]